jgi:hypothetical protein
MGKATITGGGEKGLYTAQIEFSTEGAATELAAIDAEIAQIEEELEIIEEEIDKAEAKVREKENECYSLSSDFAWIGAEAIRAAEESWEQIKDAWEEYTHSQRSQDYTYKYGGSSGASGWDSILPPPEVLEEECDCEEGEECDVCKEDGDRGAVSVGISGYRITWKGWADKKWEEAKSSPANITSDQAKEAYEAAIRCNIEFWALEGYLTAIEKMRDLRLYRKESLELRKAQIQAAVAAGDARSLWCADYTEDLSGATETIEINGAPTQVLIAPGGVAGIRDAGGPGILGNVMAMSSAQCGLAWALLPGWQKWRPTYRTGNLTAVDKEADTASVTLDAAVSIAQGLEINQSEALSNIPVEYMECNAEPFESGDNVVVEFPGQLWATGPKVVGFSSNPKPCESIEEYISFGGSSSSSSAWTGHGFRLSPEPPDPLPWWYFGEGCHITSGITCLTPANEDCDLIIRTAKPQWANALGNSTYGICYVYCNSGKEMCLPCMPGLLDWGETVWADTTHTNSGSETLTVSGEQIFSGSYLDVRHEISQAEEHGCISWSVFTYTGYERFSYGLRAAIVKDNPAVWIAIWREYITGGVDGEGEPTGSWEYAFVSNPWVYPTPGGSPGGTLAGTVAISYQTKYWLQIKALDWDLKIEVADSDLSVYPDSYNENVYVKEIKIYGSAADPVFIFSWYDLRDGGFFNDNMRYTRIKNGVVTNLEEKPYGFW